MMQSCSSGGKLAVKPRKMQFPFEQVKNPHWFNGNPILSAYFTVLSATFPPGEQSFIDSVRAFQGDIQDPVLKQQVRGFIGQEAHHRLQHERLNQHMDRLGYRATRVSKMLEKVLTREQQRHSRATLLAATVGMEHITAIMAEYFLEHPEKMEGVEPAMRDLFRWHAVEEIEHKSVAFDVYQHCVDEPMRLRKVMQFQTLDFVFRSTAYTILTLWWRKEMPSLRHWWEATRFFWGRDGMIRRLFKPYRAYYQKDFHPWQHDNSHLVADWKATLAAVEKVA